MLTDYLRNIILMFGGGNQYFVTLDAVVEFV